MHAKTVLIKLIIRKIFNAYEGAYILDNSLKTFAGNMIMLGFCIFCSS